MSTMSSFVSVGSTVSSSTLSNVGMYNKDDVENIPKSNFLQQELLDSGTLKGKRCDCRFPSTEAHLQGWEAYGLRSQYAKSNIPAKTSSSETLRRLVTDRSLKRVINGRPTALGRLINGMKKAPLPPLYEYGNCLRYLLDMDEYKTPGGFFLKQVVKHPPITTNADCYWRTDDKKPLSKRKNPFRELQLCPKLMYDLVEQPPKQEGVKRADILLDLKKFGDSDK